MMNRMCLQVVFLLTFLAPGIATVAADATTARAEQVMVDLGPVVNRSHLHEPFYAGEREDYRWLSPGVYRIRVPTEPGAGGPRNVPFRIIDPRTNHGRSIIVLKGVKNSFPTAFRIPVFRCGVRKIRVLGLAAGWGSGPKGEAVAEIVAHFDNGSVIARKLRRGIEIDDWLHHTAEVAAQVLSHRPGAPGAGHLDLLRLDCGDVRTGREHRPMLTFIDFRSLDQRTSVPIFAITLDVDGPPCSEKERAAALRAEFARLECEVRNEIAALRERGLGEEAASLEHRFLRSPQQNPHPDETVAFSGLARAYARLQQVMSECRRLAAKRRFRVVPDRNSAEFPGPEDYAIVLSRFVRYAERGFHSGYHGNPSLGWFGSGASNENGQRPLGNFIFVYSVLVVDPGYSERIGGISRDRLLEHARAALRFMTRTHVTGDLQCTDGRAWGNHWQSAWWTAKMAAGAWLLQQHGLLSSEEREAVRRVVSHEADRLPALRPPSGVWRDTKAEENAWNSEVLAWASGMYPDDPRASKWEAAARRFLINTLSVPADRTDSRLVDGRPVREQVTTENVHPDFTIENHGAYHFCYMACPLHSMTWAWYAYVATGRRPPGAALHHFRDFWNAVRPTALPRHGRFAYMSGKDWARYVYGLYFIMPPLVLLQHEFGDRDARLLERLRFETFEWEQRRNGDGGFYSDRFTDNVMSGWPSEYETDTACMLALCHRLHRVRPLIPPSTVPDLVQRVQGVRISPFCQWALARNERLFGSFSWRTLDGRSELGLFVPLGHSDMASWLPGNLTGSIQVKGGTLRRQDSRHTTRRLDSPEFGGFLTTGFVDLGTDKKHGPLVRRDLCYAVLPNQGMALLIHRFTALEQVDVERTAGLNLRLPNDMFNGGVRRISGKGGNRLLPGGNAPGDTIRMQTDWLNIDDALGIVAPGKDSAVLRSPDGRNAPWGSLRVERIAWEDGDGTPQRFAPGQAIATFGFVLAAATREQTLRLARSAFLECRDRPGLVILTVTPLDSPGKVVTLAVNFGAAAQVVHTRAGTTIRLESRTAECRLENGR